ncbi:hypothetical protein RUM44_013382 [Polyplax serrata]|uniref:Arrestin C-terminal-like domain-containing protein n=1 Tax=Polyplax serrata TaxID=468196 RepID=A0ABR1BI74_POLSC
MDKKIMELSGKKHFNSVIKYRKIAAFRLHTFFRHKDEMLCVTFSVENSSDALIKRLGPNAHAFTMSVTHLAPPSVQLVPAKEYNGAPIGTSYDIRAYIADRPDEKQYRRSTVRMGLRVLQRATRKTNSTEDLQKISQVEAEPPHVMVEKPLLLSDGKIELEARLDKAFYYHGESVDVTVGVRNNSRKTIRRIKVFIVQHVDVCMFSNGKFKNVVALVNSKEECPVPPGSSLNHTYTLHPAKGATKNWIALEDSFNKTANILASTVTCASNSPEERNVFAIYVSYYVKVKILVGAMGGQVSLKVPFTLTHGMNDVDPLMLEAKEAAEESARTNTKEPDPVSKDVKVECHEPNQVQNKNKVSNLVPDKFKTSKHAMEDENEIIKCEDKGPT